MYIDKYIAQIESDMFRVFESKYDIYFCIGLFLLRLFGTFG